MSEIRSLIVSDELTIPQALWLLDELMRHKSDESMAPAGVRELSNNDIAEIIVSCEIMACPWPTQHTITDFARKILAAANLQQNQNTADAHTKNEQKPYAYAHVVRQSEGTTDTSLSFLPENDKAEKVIELYKRSIRKSCMPISETDNISTDGAGGVTKRRTEFAKPVDASGQMPLIITFLADWERENGALAAINKVEYEALCKGLAKVSLVQSPREAELEKQIEWQPIETAPMDGSHIQLFRPNIQFVGYYGNPSSGWRINAPDLPAMWPTPTHWMPLHKEPAMPRE